jgi:hypothetical protein
MHRLGADCDFVSGFKELERPCVMATAAVPKEIVPGHQSM